MSNKKILKSSLIVIMLTILGKVLALVRDALVLSKFGTKEGTDIYAACLGIVYLLTTISYGLTTTFIPLHTDKVVNEDGEKRNIFANNVINVSTLFTIIITLVIIIFAKYFALIYVPGFAKHPDEYRKFILMLRIMMLSLLFINIQSVITGVLQSHKKFFAPASMALTSSVIYIIYLIFFASKYGITGFAVTTVIAFMAQLIINIPQYKLLGYKYKPVLNLKDSGLKKLYMLMVPVVISTSVVQLNLAVDRFFASESYKGAVTTLEYANKLNTVGYEVFAIAISMVIYPSLSAFAAKKESEGYTKTFTSAFNFLIMIMIPVAVGMAVLSLPIVSVAFQRGKFTHGDSVRTAEALMFYAPAMVAFGIRDILNKAFYSINDTITPMINSFLGIIINIFLDIVLVKYMKVAGLALGTTITLFITTTILIKKLKNNYISLDVSNMVKNIVKVTFASLVMGLVVYFINYFISSDIISIFVSFIIGVIVYFLIIMLMKIEEFSMITGLLKAKRQQV